MYSVHHLNDAKGKARLAEPWAQLLISKSLRASPRRFTVLTKLIERMVLQAGLTMGYAS